MHDDLEEYVTDENTHVTMLSDGGSSIIGWVHIKFQLKKISILNNVYVNMSLSGFQQNY